MNILVPIKRVIDYKVAIRIKPDHSGVVTDNVKMSVNPFDEIALEEAIRLKEKGVAQTVTAVTIGSKACVEQLRLAYAMGVDNAIHIESSENLEPLTIATALAALIKSRDTDTVIMGKQAIDDDNNQTGQILAAKLGWSQACFVSELSFTETHVQAVREVDGGLETLKVTRPAVITSDLRLNEPRYPSLPNIMKAKSKPIETLSLSDLSVEPRRDFETLKVTAPAARKAGVRVESVSELVDKLRNEAKVIA